MKKILLASMIVVLMGAPVFAEQVTIVALEGKALLRKDEHSKWESAQVGRTLSESAEIKTKGNARLTLAFNDRQNSVLTIEKNTRVKVENILPGSVFLSKGKVFALIKDVETGGSFEVRTPTAVAGARGTGWMTEYEGGRTSVSCFDDAVVVTNLDAAGNILDTRDVVEGFAIDVRQDGMSSEARPLAENEKGQWQEFVTAVEPFVEAAPADISGGEKVFEPGAGEEKMRPAPEGKEQSNERKDISPDTRELRPERRGPPGEREGNSREDFPQERQKEYMKHQRENPMERENLMEQQWEQQREQYQETHEQLEQRSDNYEYYEKYREEQLKQQQETISQTNNPEGYMPPHTGTLP